MTTHYEKIQALGNRMASNLETMGVSASFGDGGLTLADKILEIKQGFTDGLLLWANKNIIQTGDSVNFCALLLEDKKGVSGETIVFYDSNNPPITRSSTQTHTLNVELGSSFKLIYQSSSTYGESIMLSNEDNSLLIQYSGYDNNIYISINGGIPVTAFSCEGFLKLENGVLSDDGGHTYNLSSYNLNFKLKEMQTVGNNCSVYINPIGSAVTDANGVATVTYTGVGAGKLGFVARHGSIQSETYEVLDSLLYDSATTFDSDKWTNQGVTATYNSETGTTITTDTDYRYGSKYSLTDGLIIEFDLFIPSSIQNNPNIYIRGQNTPLGSSLYQRDVWHKIRVELGTSTLKIYCDGDNTVDTTLSNPNATFQFRVANQTSISFKNFVIYPI